MLWLLSDLSSLWLKLETDVRRASTIHPRHDPLKKFRALLSR